MADDGGIYNNKVTKSQVELTRCTLHSSNNIELFVINWWYCHRGENQGVGSENPVFDRACKFMGCKLKNQVFPKKPFFCTQTEPMVYAKSTNTVFPGNSKARAVS